MPGLLEEVSPWHLGGAKELLADQHKTLDISIDRKGKLEVVVASRGTR